MKKILFTLSLLVIFTNCSGEETPNEASVQQDTTTTTQQDTTTTTQQDTTTTTILVNVNVDPAKFCEENPDNEQCKGYNPENSQGSGNMQGSGGMTTNDSPPLLKNLLIANSVSYTHLTLPTMCVV